MAIIVKPNYKNIRAYLNYLKTFKLTNSIYPGRFYGYTYNFRKDYDWNELKFYDYMPLSFIFEIDPKTNSALGINFHHMPVRPRLLWINRVKQIAKRFEEEIQIKDYNSRPVYKIKGLNYPRVYKILLKSKIAIRRYKLDKMFYLRNIDLGNIDEVMRYYAKTYVAVNIDNIKQRYSDYKP